jgi:CoA:oxalate CoA-transferase
MSITGEEGGVPTRIGASIGDLAAGLFASIAILSALMVVRREGKGQKIDIAMLDTQVALLENAIARYTVTGEVPRPLGNRHPSISPFSSFSARDGHLIIAAGNDRLWARLCQVLELPGLVEDERF